MKTICIYHKGCADGFGAAWVVRGSLRRQGIDDVEFYPATFEEPAPDVTGKEIIIVDFSYKRPVMDEMIEQCSSMVLLDHHKSAAQDLEGIFDHPNVRGRLDMDYSGAMLAWQWFCSDSKVPELIRHIQDRDLWKFELLGTREIIACLYSYEQDFLIWDELMKPEGTQILYTEGVAIERLQKKNVASLVSASARRMVIDGHNVPAANVPYMMASDAGHLMGVNEPFSATYWDSPKGRVFSLRSSEDGGLDVSEIASKFGGGGHKHAAGFQVSLAEGEIFAAE